MASFPESEELRTPSKKHTSHISTGIQKERKKNLTHPIEVPQSLTSEYINYFGSTTVAQNTFVFAKWSVALVENAQV